MRIAIGSWHRVHAFPQVLALLAALVHSAVAQQAASPASPHAAPLPHVSGSSVAGWQPTFGGLPGVDNLVQASVFFDSGDGLALHVGGFFKRAGELQVNHVARWDGAHWATLGSGMASPVGLSPTVNDLVVFDDGQGAALYACGDFTSADGMPANFIARWDGTHWSALGSGLSDVCVALAVFDDGSGPALYAGGSFTSAGGVPAQHVAKWDGTNWSALGAGAGTGAQESVLAMAVFDDGSGPALYAGGSFTSAGGAPAGRIAKWDGASWSALDGGTSANVYALVAFQEAGGGPALYAGGAFQFADGLAVNCVARWDGTDWSALDSGLFGTASQFGSTVCAALAVIDDGSGTGPALYVGGEFATAGGQFASCLAKWTGAAWVAAPCDSVGGRVDTIAFHEDDGMPSLFVGGNLSHAGGDGLPTPFIAHWQPSGWTTVGKGTDERVRALAALDAGQPGGPALYAGGDFSVIGGTAVHHVARWDGSDWSPLGGGVAPLGHVESLLLRDEGGETPALYVGGSFLTADGMPATNLARWDGAAWSDVGGSVSGGGAVYALAEFDDGGGPAVYAAGRFSQAGGLTVNNIAKWDGTHWSALAGGTSTTSATIYGLAAFDGALYAAGTFAGIGGVPTNRIAKWNGTSWSALGIGLTNNGQSASTATKGLSLTVLDDGSGPALYVGGNFFFAGSTQARNVARWNGSSWSALGSGMDGNGINGNAVLSMAAFDDGSGPALYAGGQFETAGGSPASFMARWKDDTWSTVGSGMNNQVFALTTFDDGQGNGEALIAGGLFSICLDSGDSRLGRWSRPDVWTELGSGLAGIGGIPVLKGSGPLAEGSSGALTLTKAAPNAAALLFLALSSSPVPFKCGTLVAVPVAVALPLVTGAQGNLSLAWSAWPAGLSGLAIWWQYGVHDALAPCGASLSNALRADVP